MSILFNFALMSCVEPLPGLSRYIYYSRHNYSLAVTPFPNLSLYAQPELLIVQITYLSLQRYTVAGSCGVAISVW